MKVLEVKESNGKKVAVVGSGPSGLTVAAELAKKDTKSPSMKKKRKLVAILDMVFQNIAYQTQSLIKKLNESKNLEWKLLLLTQLMI